MSYFKLFTTILLTLFATVVMGQQHVCGLHDHALLTERLLANKKYLNEHNIHSRDATTYVPIKYHLIGKTDGSGRPAISDVLDMHCELNNFYFEEEDGFQFYIKDGFNFIDNTFAYEDATSLDGEVILAENKVANAINVFIPKTAFSNGNSVPWNGNYDPVNDWIRIEKANANGTSLNLNHQVGHYFSLLHPFNGWDFDPYNVNIHGEIVGEWSPTGNIPNELMDGSNCETAGDYICDTPPSYLFWPWIGCDYDGGARDPNGELVDPDEYNMMGFFDIDCSPKYLSEMQKAIIEVDYINRPEIHSPWSPSATSIGAAPVIVEPVDDSTTSGYDHVIFDWEPVAGATSYLLEIDRTSNFSLNPTSQIVFESYADVYGIFEADKTYHWRVTAFNPYTTCGGAITTVNKFKTGLGLNNNNVFSISDFKVEPNPVSQNYVLVTLDEKDALDAEISIVSIDGQILQNTIQYFSSGHTSIELSVEAIPNGIYFVNIKTKDQIIAKKVIVAK